jgi:hypothetical protein
MATGQTARTYLDLSIDPVNPNGVSRETELAMLRSGWEKIVLTNDVFAHVQFRNASGRTYYVDGWVKQGTEAFVSTERQLKDSPFDNIGVVRMCGNPIIVGEEKFGW